MVFAFESLTGITQGNQITFHHLTVDNGLPSGLIHCIYQDAYNFMWFGTDAGLCRFDGVKCRIYQSDANDSSSLHGNHVYAINEDGAKSLCILTERGLNIYNGPYDNFRFFAFPKIPSSSSSHVAWQIVTIPNGNILVVAGDTPYIIFDSKTNKFIGIEAAGALDYLYNDAVNKGYRFCSPCPGKAGLILWTRTANRFDKKMIAFKEYPNSRDSATVENYLPPKDSILWAATSKGLAAYNLKTMACNFYRPPGCKNIFFNSISGVGNRFWLGSAQNGVWVFDTGKKDFVASYLHDPTDTKSINGNGPVDIIFTDRQANVWFNLFAHGIEYINTSEQKFTPYLGDKYAKEKGLDNFIRALAQDSSGNVWCGTYSGSVYMFNAQKQVVASYTADATGRKFGSIEKILVDGSKRVWVLDDGLNYLDTLHHKFVRIFPKGTSPFAHDIFLTSGKKLFFIDNKYSIAVLYDSAGDFLCKTTNIHNVLNNLSVFFVDDKGKVYVNDVDGNVYVYAGFGDSYNRLAVLPVHGYIKAFWQYNNILWIATSSGLVKMNSSSLAYRIYTVKNGLPENTVYSVLPGGNGALWLSTNKGICRFDTAQQQFTNYTADDGLQSNEFNTNAYLLCSNGEAWFGGIHGLNIFKPSAVKSDSVFPPLQITSLSVNDERYYGVDVAQTNTSLRLPYRQHTVSFNFTAVEFIHPYKIILQYRLLGFDHDWITTGSPGFARYANLPAGKYVFQLRAAKGNGDQDSRIKTLQVIIATPFYQTWWFITLAATGLLALFYGWYYYRISQIKKMQMVRNNIARDLHDDIGSSISSIRIMTDIVKDSIEKNPSRSGELIKKIGNESQHVMDSIRDIVWAINPDNDLLGNMFIRMQEYAAEMLESRDIEYSFRTGEHLQNLKLSMQKRRDLYFIFKEAINNMAKYSRCTCAQISIYRVHNKLILEVKDNGIGFDVHEVKKGNGLKNIQQRAACIKATANIKSGKQEGTEVKIEIPVT